MNRWTNWTSKKLYEHPAPHQAGRFGRVARSDSGVYRLQVGGTYMNCPQDWAARIEHDESEWEPKIRRAIELLAGTKGAFKSRAVEEARELLESIVS